MKKLFICLLLLVFTSFFSFAEERKTKEEVCSLVEKFLQRGSYIVHITRDEYRYFPKWSILVLEVEDDCEIQLYIIEDSFEFKNKNIDSFSLDENYNLIIK
jgi:hypothetical protein